MLNEKSIFISSKQYFKPLNDQNTKKIENNLIDIDTEEDLKIMNSVLKNLLGLWFSIGLLNVKRIDWNSPASLGSNINFSPNFKRFFLAGYFI